MCGTQEPMGVGGALAMLDHALDVLNAADAGGLPAPVQAQVLRVLERAEAKHTAARARVLSAFSAQGGHEQDGQGSARVWLKWQTRVTSGAAAGAVGWARRLAAHPVIGQALAAGEISASWARAICGWSERLPGRLREDADRILAGAAASGADLPGLAALAEEMYQRSRGGEPDTDGQDGFDDRYLRLGITFQGAGRAEGDLTPGCAAALSAVLDALGERAGPEDTRTAAQRRHDALEEACRRLIAAGMLPGRAGQHRQMMVHITLAQLRNIPGSGSAEAAWAAAHQPGWLSGPEADAAACDATVVPVVTGRVDPAALDQLAEAFLTGHHHSPTTSPRTSGQPPPAIQPQPTQPGVQPGGLGGGTADCGCTCGRCTCPTPAPLSPATRQRLRSALLALAASTLSGPGGLAAQLRASLGNPVLTSVSLPLDIGAATETIPAHLRRAATTRHPHCAFPGCEQPASVCDIHHLVPRAEGGPTALHNLVPLCTFHHLVAIHRWGWTLTLHPDGTTTATSPDGRRVLRSHSPPARDGGLPHQDHGVPEDHSPRARDQGPARDHGPPTQAA